MTIPEQPPPSAWSTFPPLTHGQKEELTVQALGLLNEQVNARIVHYKAELETSPELDAITAQVVQQLKSLQAALEKRTDLRRTADEIEATHIEGVSTLLSRLFNPESQFTTRILSPVGRRVAKLFFQSELHQKTRGNKEKVIHHPEQGLYYVLTRYKHRLRAELDGFEFDPPETRELCLELLAKVERDLQIAFLSRRSPELNRVMMIYTAVLSDFLRSHLPQRIGAMGGSVVRAAGTARRPNSIPYRILADAFASFRAEWERVFMHEMVSYSGDELLTRLTHGELDFREETVRFFTDPHVFSDTCEVICEALYDFLSLEGLLDVPVDWRVGHDSSE